MHVRIHRLARLPRTRNEDERLVRETIVEALDSGHWLLAHFASRPGGYLIVFVRGLARAREFVRFYFKKSALLSEPTKAGR